MAAIAQWRSRLSAYVCAIGGHFEHKFWTYDFLVCFVHFFGTGFHEFDPHKHVQSANIARNVLHLCLRILRGTVATKRTRGRKFLHQVLWHSLAQLCTKNHENPSIFVKVTAKKSLTPFFI